MLVCAFAVPASASAAVSRPYVGSFGPEGLGSAAKFEQPGAIATDAGTGAIYVADTGAGSVYKFGADGEPMLFSNLGSSHLDGFSLLNPTESQIAISPTTHDLYVVDNGAKSIKAFTAAGDASVFSALGTSEIVAGEGEEFCGVAVDSSGDLYVGDYRSGVHVYAPTGELITTAAVEGICNVAVNETGDLYANHYQGAVERLVPSEYPPTPATTYSSLGTIDENVNSAVYADPTAGDVFVDEADAIVEFDRTGALLYRFANAGEGAISSSEGVAFIAVSQRAYASDQASGRVKVFGEAGQPEILSQSVTAVGPEGATLQGQVNPNGSETTAFFEYGLEPCSTGACSKTTSTALGAGETVKSLSFDLGGLVPRATYYYRVVATSTAGTMTGADRSFTTLAPQEPVGGGGCPNEATRSLLARALPDCRGYELVSPIDKVGNDIRSLPEVSKFPTAVDQSTPDGERLTFSTFGAFAEPLGAPYISQYLSTRGTGGWSTRNLTPPREGPDQKFANEFKAFTADLSSTWVVHTEGPSLAPGGPAAGPTLYKRSNGSATYEAINTGADSEFLLESRFPIQLQGVSEDGSHTLFRVPVESEGAYRLFDQVAGSLHEVSILPDGSPSPGTSSAGYAGNGGEGGPIAVLDHAMSADGSRVYWTARANFGAGPIYVRVGNSETRPVSETVSGGDAQFWLASSDGSHALFSLTDGEEQGGLYEYSFASGASERLAGELVGVVGASEDLSTVYFVSEEATPAGGATGEPNLYVARGGQLELVATLASGDNLLAVSKVFPSLVNPHPTQHTASVSANGEVVVFTSLGSLTGYDNRDARSGEPDNEVYRFDARTSKLTCLSCDPTGAQPGGREIVYREGFRPALWSAAQVPASQTPLFDPRVIADEGNRVFFDAYASILPLDTNGKEDVYEWEAPGTGTCADTSSDYFASNGGCLSLISTGADSLDSEFLDASPAGRDVFFSTAQSLIGTDPGAIDIYDARELGGFPEPPSPPTACQGEACQGATASTDQTPPPGSAAYAGPGDRRHRTKHHKKHHHKKKHHANGHRPHHPKGTNHGRRNAK
ncbi:MAG: hypothetical protein H0X42_12420 [Solirubrobacterales bacterium]|nr:hypothetical protein [Solirubrobacterales bacterium]